MSGVLIQSPPAPPPMSSKYSTTFSADKTTDVAEAAVEANDGSPTLIALTGECVGKLYDVNPSRGPVILGRGDDCEVQVQDTEISRKHAAITQKGDDMRIADLGSRNGTSINGRPVTSPVLLIIGDKIRLGNTVLRVSAPDEPEVHFARRMRSAALRDSLTNLFNRRYFDEQLIAEMAYSKRHDSPLALFMIDIDHFKKFNDTHGHLAGDLVLKKVAHHLQLLTRTEDVVSRYGGEEFAVLLRKTDPDTARLVADRLRLAISRIKVDYEGTQLRATISIGVAMGRGRAAAAATEFIGDADGALYQAKEKGRDCVVAAS